MSSEYKGKIFKLPFPFTDLSSRKFRPALALTEPDNFGDVEFVFITTSNACYSDYTLSIPENLLPFPSVLHVEKKYLLHKSLIAKEICSVPIAFLEKVHKAIVEKETKLYFNSIHMPKISEKFIPDKSRVNYAGRVYDEKEMVNLVDSSLDFWLTHGKYSEQFEAKLAEYLSIKHCLLVNSGSSANLLAFMALTSPLLKERRVNKGDEVITVAAGFPTTFAPIVQYGAVPVFVDIEIDTLNINFDLLEEAVSEKTKVVMLAHTLGNPFNITVVKEFCTKHNLWLIEDNCDALGSEFEGKKTGTFGDIGTSSFYPPHHLTMGEGGAVYTNSDLLNKIMLSMRDWGRDCWCKSGTDNSCNNRFKGQYGTLPFGYDHKYVYSHFGYNLKPTDMQAAIGCAQLEKLNSFTKRRIANFNYLYDNLKKMSNYFIFPKSYGNSSPSWFGFYLTVKENASFTRNDIVGFLEKNKIQTRNLFAGNITRQPCFESLTEKSDYRIIGKLTNTDKVMNNTFWIGVYPGMTKEMLDYMIMNIRDFCGK